ncbi:CmcJ/NvfI family oxidoreductase [Paraburkholderia jirisanensis]
MGNLVVGRQAGMVEADLNYLVPTGERPSRYSSEPSLDVPRQAGTYSAYRMPIFDARVTPPPGGLSLHRNGFELHHHSSALEDFSDPLAIESVYYPESERLLKRLTGARRVVIFDHLLRDADPARTRGAHEPVKVVHNDLTFASGPRRVRQHAPASEVDEWVNGRTAFVNLWRPIGAPVASLPLALCDSRSIAPNDAVATDLIRQHETIEVFTFAFNAAHRWYYFPHMTPSEVLLLKIHDSASEDGIARLTPHTAFDDPSSPFNAAPRRSIELRSVLLF